MKEGRMDERRKSGGKRIKNGWMEEGKGYGRLWRGSDEKEGSLGG